MEISTLEVKDISKAYRLDTQRSQPETLASAFLHLCKSPIDNWKKIRRLNTGFENEGSSSAEGDPLLHHALRNVSFGIAKGEVVGVMGGNGAGKSTLLKILSKITTPTSGRIVIRGRVASLLEVGTGFHPELTGRENIYMNGTILGMSKEEIDRKINDIIKFSGVERFLDIPVKRYSSGMQVRLAFSIAAHIEPDILIIDEVLAVGDIGFQQKCIEKIQDIASSGTTIFFVSHNLRAIQNLCDRGLVLNSGSLIYDGDIRTALETYNKLATAQSTTEHSTAYRKQRSSGGALITTVQINPSLPTNQLGNTYTGEQLKVAIHYELQSNLKKLRVQLILRDGLSGQNLGTVDGEIDVSNHKIGDSGTCTVVIESLPLQPGSYTASLRLFDSETPTCLDILDARSGFPTIHVIKSTASGAAENHGNIFFNAYFETDISF